MSCLPRYRQKFTMANRGQAPVDPFERDPFKIHSYNFRYADRPAFPLPNSPQKADNQQSLNNCETFFYNQGFLNANKLNGVDKRVSNLTKFQEYRRRRFLNRIRDLPQVKGNSSNFFNNESCTSKMLNSINRQDDIKTTESFLKQKSRYSTLSSLASLNNSLPRNIAQHCATSEMKPEYSKRCMSNCVECKSTPKRSKTSSVIITNSQQPELNSGCEININIKGLENSRSRHEKAHIKIDTDSICKNLNVTSPKAITQSLGRSNTFISNNRLSKYPSNVGKPNYKKQLTSIYSSPKFAKSSRLVANKSSERLPSLIPFQTRTKNLYRRAGPTFFKPNLTGSRNPLHVQNIRDSLSVYDSKTASRIWSPNNLNSKFRTMSSKETKLSPRCSASQRNDSKFTFSSKVRSNDRLPLNININVFADNLKLLNV